MRSSQMILSLFFLNDDSKSCSILNNIVLFARNPKPMTLYKVAGLLKFLL